jgi:hypothetical protein
MKKVSLLILLVIVLSTVLMAAVPTKMARITIINKSDYDVFMKLTGSSVTDAFYYLTIPTGSRDQPTVKIFTVMQDLYDRETWACNGFRTTGQLFVTSNLRLTFTPCGVFFASSTKHINGEPTMEKVVAFRYLYPVPGADFSWWDANLYGGYWNWGCATFAWRARTYRRPILDGCYWRYQY